MIPPDTELASLLRSPRLNATERRRVMLARITEMQLDTPQADWFLGVLATDGADVAPPRHHLLQSAPTR